MRCLIDHNVGRGVAQALASDGHDAIFVGDVDLHMIDTDILAWAVRDQRILITQDHDFGALVYRSGWSHRGVLLLRMGEGVAVSGLPRFVGFCKSTVKSSLITSAPLKTVGCVSVNDRNVRIVWFRLNSHVLRYPASSWTVR
jgi:predicted nuclease of predicted toxin-antitoxin system